MDRMFLLLFVANDVAESFLSVFACDWDIPSDIDSGRPPSELPQAVSLKHTEVVVKSSSTFELSLALLYSLTSALRSVCLSLCLRSLSCLQGATRSRTPGSVRWLLPSRDHSCRNFT